MARQGPPAILGMTFIEKENAATEQHLLDRLWSTLELRTD